MRLRNAWTCYNLQERLMPHLRGQTARRLHERGMRQGRIAEHLGVSQAMVSKYLRVPSGPPPGVPTERLHEMVERAVGTVLSEEQLGRVPAWCPLCPGAADGDAAQLPEECLRGERFPDPDDGRRVLQTLERAAARIRRRPFGALAPEVNINLAMASPRATDARGVAAFPGRLVEARGEVRPVSAPAFGVSRHLSEVLLRVRAQSAAVQAVLCLRDAPDVRAAVRGARLRPRILRRRKGELLVAYDPRERPDVLVDPGDFGIEPISYVLGSDALDAVAKAERILEHLPSTRSAP